MRKALGMLALTVGLIVYVIVAMEIGVRLHSASPWIQAAYYIVAGVAWALPLRGFMRWWMTEPSRKG